MADLLIGEACRILDLHPNTLRRYAANGLVQATRDRNGYRRFSYGEVLRFKKELQERIPEGSMERQLLGIITRGIQVFTFLLKSRLDRIYPSDGSFSTDPSYAVDMAQHSVNELQRLRAGLEENPNEAGTIRVDTSNVLLEALKTEHVFPSERDFFTTVRGLIAECEQLEGVG